MKCGHSSCKMPVGVRETIGVESMTMRIKRLYLATACLAVLAAPARADVIDFETAFVDQQSVGAVTTATNTVTFSVGKGATPLTSSGTSDAFIAQVGGKTTAFVSKDNTVNPTISGQYFLTDEFDGPRKKLSYFLLFEVPVLDLSLDLYDYRIDGGPKAGDRATLTAYSDPFLTVVGEDVYAIPDDPSQNPQDGHIESLAIVDAALPILAVTITFSKGDVGTAIDNILFNTIDSQSILQVTDVATVPEPAPALLMSLGLVGIFVTRRRRGAGPAFAFAYLRPARSL